MGWRTIVVTKNCKLSYKNDYLIIRSETLQMIHLSEINLIIIENGMVSITSYLINELINNKIKLMFCDETHNPAGEIVPYYNSFNTSKKVQNQIKWKKTNKDEIWQQIVKHKIHNQAMLLRKLEIDGYNQLFEYEKNVEVGDKTNREGHAAKVYFNLLFGKKFIRGSKDDINISLDYGYSIILSTFNKEIVSKGYITQIGINHKNEYNPFNLSCDLMEPYRPLIDEIVYNNINNEFNKTQKYKLLDVLNRVVTFNNKEQYVSNAIPIYIQSVFNALENIKESKVNNYEI
jgi:CRISP-associated protein Cas1